MIYHEKLKATTITSLEFKVDRELFHSVFKKFLLENIHVYGDDVICSPNPEFRSSDYERLSTLFETVFRMRVTSAKKDGPPGLIPLEEAEFLKRNFVPYIDGTYLCPLSQASTENIGQYYSKHGDLNQITWDCVLTLRRELAIRSAAHLCDYEDWEPKLKEVCSKANLEWDDFDPNVYVRSLKIPEIEAQAGGDDVVNINVNNSNQEAEHQPPQPSPSSALNPISVVSHLASRFLPGASGIMSALGLSSPPSPMHPDYIANTGRGMCNVDSPALVDTGALRVMSAISPSKHVAHSDVSSLGEKEVFVRIVDWQSSSASGTAILPRFPISPMLVHRVVRGGSYDLSFPLWAQPGILCAFYRYSSVIVRVKVFKAAPMNGMLAIGFAAQSDISDINITDGNASAAVTHYSVLDIGNTTDSQIELPWPCLQSALPCGMVEAESGGWTDDMRNVATHSMAIGVLQPLQQALAGAIVANIFVSVRFKGLQFFGRSDHLTSKLALNPSAQTGGDDGITTTESNAENVETQNQSFPGSVPPVRVDGDEVGPYLNPLGEDLVPSSRLNRFVRVDLRTIPLSISNAFHVVHLPHALFDFAVNTNPVNYALLAKVKRIRVRFQLASNFSLKGAVLISVVPCGKAYGTDISAFTANIVRATSFPFIMIDLAGQRLYELCLDFSGIWGSYVLSGGTTAELSPDRLVGYSLVYSVVSPVESAITGGATNILLTTFASLEDSTAIVPTIAGVTPQTGGDDAPTEGFAATEQPSGDNEQEANPASNTGGVVSPSRPIETIVFGDCVNNLKLLANCHTFASWLKSGQSKTSQQLPIIVHKKFDYPWHNTTHLTSGGATYPLAGITNFDIIKMMFTYYRGSVEVVVWLLEKPRILLVNGGCLVETFSNVGVAYNHPISVPALSYSYDNIIDLDDLSSLRVGGTIVNSSNGLTNRIGIKLPYYMPTAASFINSHGCFSTIALRDQPAAIFNIWHQINEIEYSSSNSSLLIPGMAFTNAAGDDGEFSFPRPIIRLAITQANYNALATATRRTLYGLSVSDSPDLALSRHIDLENMARGSHVNNDPNMAQGSHVFNQNNPDFVDFQQQRFQRPQVQTKATKTKSGTAQGSSGNKPMTEISDREGSEFLGPPPECHGRGEHTPYYPGLGPED
jgi:hypothetical protein